MGFTCSTHGNVETGKVPDAYGLAVQGLSQRDLEGISFTFTADDDTLALTIDDDLSVIDVAREPIGEPS